MYEINVILCSYCS